MKSIFKTAALLVTVLMILCVTGCGDTAGGTTAQAMQRTPLTLEANQDGYIMLCSPEKMTNLKYKKNDDDFVIVTASTSEIDVVRGDKVAFYAEGSNNDIFTYFRILSYCDCYVYGNVMSLLSSSNFANISSVPQYAFKGLFLGNASIYNHPQKTLVLPATTLAEGCYQAMFLGCTGLTSVPTLPATTLANSCYSQMFQGCTGLTSAPTLPATTLAEWCYDSMFYGCTILTSAPDLPAQSLTDHCYYEMFKNCSNLASVTCLATDISANVCTYNWLDGVASSGTFTKAASMDDWTEDNSGIPTGWTVVDYTAPQQ